MRQAVPCQVIEREFPCAHHGGTWVRRSSTVRVGAEQTCRGGLMVERLLIAGEGWPPGESRGQGCPGEGQGEVQPTQQTTERFCLTLIAGRRPQRGQRLGCAWPGTPAKCRA